MHVAFSGTKLSDSKVSSKPATFLLEWTIFLSRQMCFVLILRYRFSFGFYGSTVKIRSIGITAPVLDIQRKTKILRKWNFSQISKKKYKKCLPTDRPKSSKACNRKQAYYFSRSYGFLSTHMSAFLKILKAEIFESYVT